MQYDTIYHEHMRYYSLTSLNKLFLKNKLYIFHAKEIPTHGGSIRVYVSKNKRYKKTKTLKKILNKEQKIFTTSTLENFKKKVLESKLELISRINLIKKEGYKIFIDTVESYLKNVNISNHSFENFMKEKWPGDYTIYMDNKNKTETSSLRTYKHWETMYDEVKNNNKDIDFIMNIGEQGILQGK